MGVKQKRDHRKEWAKTKIKLEQRKQALINKLGGVCPNPDNNPNCTKTENLEFHHLQGKPWSSIDFGPKTRMKQYEIDAEAGLLGLLCKSCNSKDGALNKHYYSLVRHSHPLEKAPF